MYKKSLSAKKGVGVAVTSTVALLATGIISKKLESSGVPISDEIKVGIAFSITTIIEAGRNWFKHTRGK